MRNLMIAVAAVFAFMFTVAQAEDARPTPKPRVMINGRIGDKEIKLAPGKASVGSSVQNFTWEPEEKRVFGVFGDCNVAKSGEWTTFTISFTPETDGKVTLSLLGNWQKSKGILEWPN